MARSEAREASDRDDIVRPPVETDRARREADDAGWSYTPTPSEEAPGFMPRMAEAGASYQDPGDREPRNFTNDQSEFVGSEIPTDAGSAFFYPDDVTYRDAAKEVPLYPGEYVLDTHGTPESVQLKDNDGNLRELNAPEFADVVRTTSWNGEPIRLFACETGQRPDGFAQELANELEVPVTAPTETVSTYTDADGNIGAPEVGSYKFEIDPETGSLTQKWQPGEWVTYLPENGQNDILEQDEE